MKMLVERVRAAEGRCLQRTTERRLMADTDLASPSRNDPLDFYCANRERKPSRPAHMQRDRIKRTPAIGASGAPFTTLRARGRTSDVRTLTFCRLAVEDCASITQCVE